MFCYIHKQYYVTFCDRVVQPYCCDKLFLSHLYILSSSLSVFYAFVFISNLNTAVNFIVFVVSGGARNYYFEGS